MSLNPWMLKTILFTWPLLLLVTCGHDEDPPAEADLQKVRELPAELYENSGMTEYDGLLWIINDSGNEPVIIGYNAASGQIERTVWVSDAVNHDWEEISQDAAHLYIGDFGNNVSGNRSDLQIWIIEKAGLANGEDSVTVSGSIHFTYEDQDDFSAMPANSTSFDCEAFIAIEDSLVLFSKDWLTQKTKIYTIPVIPGNYEARLRNESDVTGLVTASAYDPVKQQLLLLGYTTGWIPLIWDIPGFNLENLEIQGGERFEFPEFFGTQTEGIAISSDGSVYVGCEESPLVKSALFRALF